MPLCCIKNCKHSLADCKMVRFPNLENDAKVWQNLIRTSDKFYLKQPSHRICLCHFSSRQFSRLMPYDVTKTLKMDAFPDKCGLNRGPIKKQSRQLITPSQESHYSSLSSVTVAPTPGSMAYPCTLPSTSKTVGFLIPVQTVGGQIQLSSENANPETKGQISMPVKIISSTPGPSQTLARIVPATPVQPQQTIKPSCAPVLPTASSVAPNILSGLKQAFSKVMPKPIQPLKEADFFPVFLKEEKLEVLDDEEFKTDMTTMSQTYEDEPGITNNPNEESDMDVDEVSLQDDETLEAETPELSHSPLRRSSRNTAAKLAPTVFRGLKKAFAKLKPPEPLNVNDFLSLTVEEETDDDATCSKNIPQTFTLPKVSELCRLCAKPKTGDLIPILGNTGRCLNIKEKINQHLPIKFSEKEQRLPMNVCSSCINKLNVCHELISQCTLADAKLHQLIDLEDQQLGFPIPCSQDSSKYSKKKRKTKRKMNPYSVGNNADSDNDNTDLCHQADTDEHIMSNMETTTSRSDSSISKSEKFKNLKGYKKCPFDSCCFLVRSLKNFKSHLYKKHQKEMCDVCEDIFDTNEELADHINDKHSKPVICEICGETVESVNLQQHLKKHNKKTKTQYECNICSKTGFRKKLDHDIHMSRHQTERTCKCSICDKTFFHENDVKKHQRAIHRENFVLRCADCNTTFKTKSALNAHMFMRHLSEWKYSCNICKFECTDQEQINSHISETHSKEKTAASLDELLFTRKSDYECTICKNTYANSFCLNKHKYRCSVTKRKVIIKSKNRMKKCQFCSELFCGRGTLGRHLRLDHKITVDVTDSDLHGIGTKKVESYECNLCGKKLSSKSSLQIHFRFHTKEKPFQCSQCNESFYLGQHLEAHENKIHKNVTPYHCEKCTRKFYGRHLLFRHMRSHTKPLTCQYCGKNFAFRGQLRIHELIHTGEKPHKCQICSRGFTQKHEMETHQLGHLHEKKFKCSNCNYKSNKLQDIVNHIEHTYAPSDNVVVIKQDLSNLM